MKKLRVAVVSNVVLDSLKSGQQKRIFDLVSGLSSEFQVDYIEITDKDTMLSTKRFLESNVNYISLNLNYKHINKFLINLLTVLFYPILGIKKSVFVGVLGAYTNRKVIKKWDYDIVVAEYYMNSFFFKFITNSALKIIDMHDLQFITLQSSLSNKRWPFKKLMKRFSRKIEVNCLKKADALISVNLNEINCLYNFGIMNKSFFLPLTTNEYIHEIGKNNIDFKKEISFAYFAGLSSQRSFFELEYILKEIWPIIYSKFEYSNFYIIGNNPSQKVVNLCQGLEHVHLLGGVEDLQYTFKKIHFLINYWIGQSYGFRTRIIDVLNTGTPIFLNKESVDGMGFGTENSLMYFENASEITDKLEYLINNELDYANLCSNSLLAAKKYNSKTVYKSFNSDLMDYYKAYYK